MGQYYRGPLSSLKVIPGYGGDYLIDVDSGSITNRHRVILKQYPSKRGTIVELRHFGQREKVLVSELLRRVEAYENNGL